MFPYIDHALYFMASIQIIAQKNDMKNWTKTKTKLLTLVIVRNLVGHYDSRKIIWKQRRPTTV